MRTFVKFQRLFYSSHTWGFFVIRLFIKNVSKFSKTVLGKSSVDFQRENSNIVLNPFILSNTMEVRKTLIYCYNFLIFFFNFTDFSIVQLQSFRIRFGLFLSTDFAKTCRQFGSHLKNCNSINEIFYRKNQKLTVSLLVQ